VTNAYTVIVKFTVTDATDEHLQHEQTIKDEITSWLESLKAEVEDVSVDKGEPA
jgi:hypothetical protein